MSAPGGCLVQGNLLPGGVWSGGCLLGGSAPGRCLVGGCLLWGVSGPGGCLLWGGIS